MPNTPQVDFSNINDLENYINLQYDEASNTEGEMNVRIEHNALFGILKFLKVAYATPNQPPVVNAGTDQSINLPTNTISVVASASDPDGTIVSVLWEQVSGPTQAVITSNNTVNTTFNNLGEGVYVFKITATDNRGASANDTVTITVNYVLPTVDAGADQSVTRPSTPGGAITTPSFITSFVSLAATGNREVKFPSSSIGYMANTIVIFKTTDGGATWTPTNSPLGFYRSISFFNELEGYACGSNGLIIRTTDGGATWTTQTSGTTELLNKILVISQIGAMVIGDGGTILTTANSGTTWVAQNSGTTESLSNAAIVNIAVPTILVVGNNGTLLRTNGGVNWTPVSLGTSASLNEIFFFDSNNGWIGTGDGTIYRTTNGGASWTQSFFNSTQFTGLYFTSATNGYAVGQDLGQAVFAETTDGGATWVPVPYENLSNPSDITFSNDNYYISDGAGTVHKYSLQGFTGSGTFTQQTTGVTSTIRSISFATPTLGFALPSTGASILCTTDGGATWATQTNPSGFIMNSVKSINGNRAVAVGENGTVLRTSDGGATWTLGTSNTLEILYDVAISPSYYIAVGSNGLIARSIDLGSSWTVATVGTNAYFGISYVLDAGNQGFWCAVGENGAIATSDNNGLTWVQRTSGVVENLNKVFFINRFFGYAVGNSNTLLTTGDGGVTWTLVPLPILTSTVDLLDIQFVNDNYGYISGTNGVLLRTTNGGATWSSFRIFPTFNITSIQFITPTLGWAAGANGRIINASGITYGGVITPATATVSATVTPGSYAISSSVLPIWEITASPAGATPTLTAPNSASTSVQGMSAAGTYTIRHTVEDINGRSANDSTNIIVS